MQASFISNDSPTNLAMMHLAQVQPVSSHATNLKPLNEFMPHRKDLVYPQILLTSQSLDHSQMSMNQDFKSQRSFRSESEGLDEALDQLEALNESKITIQHYEQQQDYCYDQTEAQAREEDRVRSYDVAYEQHTFRVSLKRPEIQESCVTSRLSDQRYSKANILQNKENLQAALQEVHNMLNIESSMHDTIQEETRISPMRAPFIQKNKHRVSKTEQKRVNSTDTYSRFQSPSKMGRVQEKQQWMRSKSANRTTNQNNITVDHTDTKELRLQKTKSARDTKWLSMEEKQRNLVELN